MWSFIFSNYLFFLLVFTRVSGMILFNPIFSRRNIPGMVKVCLTFFLAVVVSQIIPLQQVAFRGIPDFVFACMKEMLVGLAVSTVFYMIMSVLHIAGEIIDVQIGVGMSKMYDPNSNVSMSLTATVFNLMFVLIFFAGNGHLTFIKIMTLSYNIFPAGADIVNYEFAQYIAQLFGYVLMLAVKLALPVIAIEMISEFGLGIIMRTIPQINVFVVGIQLKLIIGLLVIIMILPSVAAFLDSLTEIIFTNISKGFELLT